MNINMILTVPESLNIEDVDGNGDFVIGNDAMTSIAMLGPRINKGPLYYPVIVPDTHAVAGKKLALSVITTDAADPLSLIETLILTYSLDWQVMGMQPFYLTMVDDGMGGQMPLVFKSMDTAVLDYFNDRFIESVQQTPELNWNWLPAYKGSDQWR